MLAVSLPCLDLRHAACLTSVFRHASCCLSHSCIMYLDLHHAGYRILYLTSVLDLRICWLYLYTLVLLLRVREYFYLIAEGSPLNDNLKDHDSFINVLKAVYIAKVLNEKKLQRRYINSILVTLLSSQDVLIISKYKIITLHDVWLYIIMIVWDGCA